MAKAEILQDGHGYYIQWYRDSDGDSGYGDNAQLCFWYAERGASRSECEHRAAYPPHDPCAPLGPATLWTPIEEAIHEGPPFDAATATGMYDHW